MSSTKMKQRSEFGRRIKALRKNQQQADFAKRLGVSGSQVSAWETGRDVPGRDALLDLAHIASDPEEKLWFYRKARIDSRDLLTAAEHLQRALMSEPERGEVVHVPIYNSAKGREEAGPPLALPAKYVPNLGSTFCFVVDKESTGLVFVPGDVIVLDESDRGARDLAPFWDKLVLAEFTRPSGPVTGYQHWQPHRGLAMGVLRCRTYNGVDWIAELAETLRDTASYTAIPVGWWRPARAAQKDAEVQARRHLRPMQCEILGHALFWIRASGEQGK